MPEDAKSRYFDRELSWLEFNGRVLCEAMAESNPLLERLRFMGIVSSNFHEFFMVRAPGLRGDGERAAVCLKAAGLIGKQYDYLLKILVPALEAAGLKRLSAQALDPAQREFIRKLFQTQISPLLTPLALHEGSPLPSFLNLSLYLVVALADAAGGTGGSRYAVVELPKSFPRIVSLPAKEGYPFMFFEDVVSIFARDLFSGYEIVDQGLARLTRAAELTFEEEKDEDFADLMTEALKMRHENDVVRLEVCASEALCGYLKGRLGLEDAKVYNLPGWLDLKSISTLALQGGFDALKYPVWTPQPVADFQNAEDIWTVLKEGDRIAHHPYESFDAVVRFIALAARDPQVLAIKQTLYRTAGDSLVVNALEKAAMDGKRVTAVVELKARFDEENNIQWARRLERAGVNVLYGVAGLKTHAKACLVVRRETEGIKRYVHLSTGNYNERTARVYSDISYFTCDDAMTHDVSAFFNVVTGYSQPVGLNRIEMAPYTLRPKLKRLILREAMRSRRDQPGLIVAKMNSLVDPEIIEALYRACEAGVQIKLNVRGICCLKPGVQGLSENIEVVSVVDMFLEHSRMFYFSNGGDDELYLSSADWMPRNLDRRLEIMFPVEPPVLKKSLTDLLMLYFKDNVKAWKLKPDGSYERGEPGHARRFRVQEHLCSQALKQESAHKALPPAVIKPQKPQHRPAEDVHPKTSSVESVSG